MADDSEPKAPEAGESKRAREEGSVKSRRSAREEGSVKSRRSVHSSSSGKSRERRSGEKRNERPDRDRRSRRESRSKSNDKDQSFHRRKSSRRRDSRSPHESRERRDRRDGDKSGTKSPKTSDRDREAKRQARKGRDEGTSARPGVVAVADDSAGSRRVRDKVSRSNSRSAVRRSDEDREAKRRAKEGRSSSRTISSSSSMASRDREAKRRAREGRSRGTVAPGAASGSSMESRDREAKRRAREGRSSGTVAPGAAMASNRGSDDIRRKQKMQGRSGASRSRGADNRKNLQNMSPEPVATAAGDLGEGVAVEAVAIDEATEENERMRALEEQNRALASRMETMMNNPVPNTPEDGQVDDDDKDNEAEDAVDERIEKKKRYNCIFVFVLLAVGGGIAAYFLTKSGDPIVTPIVTPDDSNKDTPAPVVPEVESRPPTAPDTSEGPSSSPTIDTYDPPGDDDCTLIKNGMAIEGQDKLENRPFRMSFDIELKDPNLSVNTWVPLFKEGVDKVLIPALTGCPTPRRRLTAVSPGLRKMTPTKTLEQSFEPRQLQEIESDIRYVIANAKATISLSRDVSDDCEIKRAGCNNVKVVMELFLKGEEKGFAIITLIAQILQVLADRGEILDRRLEQDGEHKRHHRKLLVRSLGLDPDIFRSIGYRPIENMDPTTSPSISPSQVPSRVPSVKPSRVPSVSPTIAPTTLAPTGEPTETPTVGPTKRPTPGPTPGTPGPTPNPTPGPTPNPTPNPTPLPTPGPTETAPQPVEPLTPQPSDAALNIPDTPAPYDYDYPTFAPYDYNYDDAGSCMDDTSFISDSGNKDCTFYGVACAGTAEAEESGTCAVLGPCSAMTACCVCNGNAAGCQNDYTYTDNMGFGCWWYEYYDNSEEKNCPDYGNASGGECEASRVSCQAKEACSGCKPECAMAP